MENLFKAVYNLIYNLGTVIIKIIGGFFGGIFRTVKKLAHFTKASFSSAKVFFKRTVIAVLVVALVSATIVFASNNTDTVKAVSLKIGDDVIGYAPSQKAASVVKKSVTEVLGEESAEKITVTDTKTAACNIKNTSALSEAILNKIAKKLVSVAEIYIDGEFLCAVENVQTARDIINKTLESAKKMYPDASVSFAEKISVKTAYRSADNSVLYTAQQLENALTSSDVLTVRHTKCEESIAVTDYDTVEIQTNTLFVGDTRVRRAGQSGSEYAINLVTYIGNQKVLSEHLMSVAIKEAVPQIVERGIRAESLSMGSYTVIQTTGIFCWPAVNLYTVTSPFGQRSLGYHRGIDISGGNAAGSLVVAGASGTVVEAGWSTGGYGNYCLIDHGNGVETLYAHMLDDSLMVNPGDTVQKGQTLGRVGNTGYSFGAHLHFEVRINGNRVNPAPYLGLE